MTISEEGRAAYENAARLDIERLRRQNEILASAVVLLSYNLRETNKTVAQLEGLIAKLQGQFRALERG